MTRQNTGNARARETAETIAAGRSHSAGEAPAAQGAGEQRRQPSTEEAKRQYATAKAQAQRDERAADAAKWTASEVGGYQRDVRGAGLRLWVGEDGTWSITPKTDPCQAIATGTAATVEQAQADAAVAAMDQVSVMIAEITSRPRKRKQLPMEPNALDNRREVANKLRSAISDLLPSTLAAVRRPKRESSPRASSPQLSDPDRTRGEETGAVGGRTVLTSSMLDHRATCSFCAKTRILYPGPRCRDCCDDEVFFLYTVTEMETHGVDPRREITDGTAPDIDDLREVAMELLSRLQSRALAAGKRIPLDMLARKIIDSRSCNLEADTGRRSRHQDAGSERPGRSTPVKCPECGRRTKLRLTTGTLNVHQNDQQEWCAAAGREISTPRTDPDAYRPPPVPRPAVDGRIVRVDPTPQTAATIPLVHRSMGLPARSWLRFG